MFETKKPYEFFGNIIDNIKREIVSNCSGPCSGSILGQHGHPLALVQDDSQAQDLLCKPEYQHLRHFLVFTSSVLLGLIRMKLRPSSGFQVLKSPPSCYIVELRHNWRDRCQRVQDVSIVNVDIGNEPQTKRRRWRESFLRVHEVRILNVIFVCMPGQLRKSLNSI